MYNHITCCKSENKNWIKMKKKKNLPKTIVYTKLTCLRLIKPQEM